jgi:CRISP-associated protein Cas1
VLYLTEAKDQNYYWNIPIANTTVILLGTGTSITQAAMRMLASAGVLVGFCGGGGSPLFSGSEIEWLNPQSEYRPTEYVQGWLNFWFDEAKRLSVAKTFQQARIDYLKRTNRTFGQKTPMWRLLFTNIKRCPEIKRHPSE